MPGPTLEPEVIPPGRRLPARDPWIERIAILMDGAIPIGPWTIGLDAILGLVPGFGDVAAALISMLIVLRAVQAGVPRIAVARMMANIAIDTLVGSIPVLGDLFDVAYKSNMMNLRIYEEFLEGRPNAAARHWGFFAALLLGVGAAGAALIAAVVWAVRAIGYRVL
jgi:hypothetical protein